MRAACIVMDGKGGVWKSTIAQAVTIALADNGKRVVDVVDADTTNALMVSAFGESTRMIDLGEAEAAGRLAARLKSSSDFCVIDIGARDEARVRELLPDLCSVAARERCLIVVFRPITLSSHTQRNAVSFAKFAKEIGVKTVMVQTRGQGRTLKHFAPWELSKLRAAALSWGAVETWMSDVGVRWADEIPAFGINFAEVACGDFSRVAEADRADAEQIFDEDLQSHMSLWLHSNVTRFREAMTSVGLSL